MLDKKLLSTYLGLGRTWRVSSVEMPATFTSGEVVINLEHSRAVRTRCPECGKPCSRHDHLSREWRHVDMLQHRTRIVARVPRVRCPEHGTRLVSVPWAEVGSRQTAMFEAVVICWLRSTDTASVSRMFGLGWHAVDGIKRRAVERGRRRRGTGAPLRRLCVDETSFARRHSYVTVVTDKQSGAVAFVGVGRTKESLGAYLSTLTQEQREGVEWVSMDMWKAYISAVREHIPGADGKISFDKFHVCRDLNKSVDTVRKNESKELAAAGDGRLKGTKHSWLRNATGMSPQQREGFEALRKGNLRTARAWAIKEQARALWDFDDRGDAEAAWLRWHSWATRSGLEPVRKAAKTIKDHLWGIVNAIVLKADNGQAESVNSRIKLVKVRSRGFRNMDSFITSIYFHLGGLDMMPEGFRRLI